MISITSLWGNINRYMWRSSEKSQRGQLAREERKKVEETVTI